MAEMQGILFSENYHESFPDEDWGREAEQVFDILPDHKDF